MKILYLSKMFMATKNNIHKFPRKQLVIRLIFLAIYLLILSYLYYFLVESGSNPAITILIILFLLLLTIGLLFRKKGKSLYSKIFPDKKKIVPSFEKSNLESQKKEVEQTVRRIHRPINLSTKYYKPIVLKCKNCGNMIPNFVKQCPFCNKKVKY